MKCSGPDPVSANEQEPARDSVLEFDTKYWTGEFKLGQQTLFGSESLHGVDAGRAASWNGACPQGHEDHARGGQ